MVSVFGAPQKKVKKEVAQEQKKNRIFGTLSSEPTMEAQEEAVGLKDLLTDEQLERDIERAGAQGIQNLIAGAAGLPGDIVELANKITGGSLPFLQQTSEIIPGREKLQEFGERATLGYTKPVTKFEETAKEFMGDVGAGLSFGVPNLPMAGGKVLTAARLWQPLITPLLGQSVKKSAESFGASPTSSDFWKIGAMITFDVLFNRGAGSQKYINGLFQEANRAIPQGAVANANNLIKELDVLQTTLQRGGASPTTTRSLQAINELRGLIKKSGKNKNTIEVAELPAFRVNLNAVKSQLGGYKSELQGSVKKQAVRNVDRVKKAVIDSGMEYGRTQNRQFGEYWSAANEASNIAQRSNLVSNFLQSVLPKPLLYKVLGSGAVAHAGAAYLGGSA